MTVLAGGMGAIILGLIGLAVWREQFLVLLAGGIPIALLLGGALAVYVGMDELKDKMQVNKESEQKAKDLGKTQEELEEAKAQAEKYKEELEKLKKETQKKEEK